LGRWDDWGRGAGWGLLTLGQGACVGCQQREPTQPHVHAHKDEAVYRVVRTGGCALWVGPAASAMGVAVGALAIAIIIVMGAFSRASGALGAGAPCEPRRFGGEARLEGRVILGGFE
jgi:hypothetical protein